MWRSRYWAVLGFQVILALTAVSSLLFLLVAAEHALDILVALVALAVSGTMFWFLVKALARIQMPDRRPPD
jgi:cellobiose-specific phosphotransferase system component IIC